MILIILIGWGTCCSRWGSSRCRRSFLHWNCCNCDNYCVRNLQGEKVILLSTNIHNTIPRIVFCVLFYFHICWLKNWVIYIFNTYRTEFKTGDKTLAAKLFATLTDIQMGRVEDKKGWIVELTDATKPGLKLWTLFEAVTWQII